jgi:hypothetical protein
VVVVVVAIGFDDELVFEVFLSLSLLSSSFNSSILFDFFED